MLEFHDSRERPRAGFFVVSVNRERTTPINRLDSTLLSMSYSMKLSHLLGAYMDNIGKPVTKLVVLLVDPQVMVGEGIRRMLADESDIEFHYCQDPHQAVSKANEIHATIILHATSPHLQ